MSKPQEGDPIVEPAWMISRIDQKLALLKQVLPGGINEDVIIMALEEPPPEASAATTARWERSCDHCQVYCPPHGEFYTGNITRFLGDKTRPVVITFGVCARCAESMRA